MSETGIDKEDLVEEMIAVEKKYFPKYHNAADPNYFLQLISKARNLIQSMRLQLSAAQERERVYRDALEKYGFHEVGCAFFAHGSERDCDCGWNDASAALSQPAPSGEVFRAMEAVCAAAAQVCCRSNICIGYSHGSCSHGSDLNDALAALEAARGQG